MDEKLIYAISAGVIGLLTLIIKWMLKTMTKKDEIIVGFTERGVIAQERGTKAIENNTTVLKGLSSLIKQRKR